MSGIRDLIPGSVIDATMFNPCGYSMNGMKTDVRGAPAIICASISLVIIIDQAKQGSAISLDWFFFKFIFFSNTVLQGTYWTIHITPEPEFSYVSFETNLSQTSYDDLIRKVVDIFKPGKFVTTLFVNQVSASYDKREHPFSVRRSASLDMFNAEMLEITPMKIKDYLWCS